MPRTFSRGEKFTAETVERLFQYIPEEQAGDFLIRMRVLFCPEAPLVEQDLMDFFDFLFDSMQRLQDLTDALTGGGLIPGSMRTVITELNVEAVRTRRKFERIQTIV